MDFTEIINDSIQVLGSSAAGAYFSTLEIPKVVGQELVKENVIKLYNWFLEQFKRNDKSDDLKQFVKTPDNQLLQGKVISSLETILKNEDLKKELMILLQNAHGDLSFGKSANKVIVENIHFDNNKIDGDIIFGVNNKYGR